MKLVSLKIDIDVPEIFNEDADATYDKAIEAVECGIDFEAIIRQKICEVVAWRADDIKVIVK